MTSTEISMLEVGLRVVRGPDWKWKYQDDGEGHVGTVVEIGRSGSETSPDKTVVVQWDGGKRTNYRVGYQGAYDLRLWDNAPAGVKHPNIICDGCNQAGIIGMRWRCEHCTDFDLCSQCYMSDKHDVNHAFRRFEKPAVVGVLAGTRKQQIKVQLKGIFIGAKVVRGHDWDWSEQDGGEGKTGRVTDIRGWENESGRSVASVTWTTSGSTNVYRLGHKGKVDLRCVEEGIGGFYYREHLPVLGQSVEDALAGSMARSLVVPLTQLSFSVGDKVRIIVDVDALKLMQEGHGGWNPRMAELIGKVGTVHRVTERGDIRVQYEDCPNRWTFNPGALSKQNCIAVGDFVRVIDDAERVKEYQQGHGEWVDVMRSALGLIGVVVKVYSDGDLRVSIGSQTWTLNPLAVQLVPAETDQHNTNADSAREGSSDPTKSVLSVGEETKTGATSPDEVIFRFAVSGAAQGHTQVVKKFLQSYSDKIDSQIFGKTFLQVAAHQGHADLVVMLLAEGAYIDREDEDGDTPLHYSAFGNQPAIMELLLSKGANRNAVNKQSCTPLHVAVNKQYHYCVRVLLTHKCNVNIQDLYGDTALHDAIGKESAEITELLCNVPSLDFTVRNKRGFNVLHHAALKGNNLAMEKLLIRSRQLVDVKKEDGFAALHLACLNGHRAVAETLILQGQATVDLRNNRKQTPLLLAVSQGHCAVVELCVSARADVDAEDEDGDTALHLALLKRHSISVPEISELEAPTIFGIHSQLPLDLPTRAALAIACYLVQEGCSLEKRNLKGSTPLDYVTNTPLAPVLRSYVTHRSLPAEVGSAQATEGETSASSPAPSPSRSPTGASEEDADSHERPTPVECAVCSELSEHNVLFEPCGHRIACEDCAARMKKCLKCGQDVVKRTTKDGRIIARKSRQPSVERMRYLESKIAEIEEVHCCSICMERRRNVVFLCGHSACDKCSNSLRVCHMCRKTITKKISLY